ncbi:response regulator transcription factor [Bacillus sp. 31A1R]|uniref:Response regulator transcription factor n=1 Tax=Robertmurraya mangrovi TaxID=3098077 RepID=A0ABU5IW03_9BACI|nr:response regulator transcription factor [Bacillus sp. 31A1R]MDZ5471332.1 response regulator transcription factor [Bacillus sp. 31A1R]
MVSILIVEDDEMLCYGLQYAFEKEQWQTYIANSIHEADVLLKKINPSLILLDNNLPDGLGFNFCKKMRASSHTPIIFLTAADEEIDIVRGLDMGADDYLTKPFRVMELISRIKSVLRRSQGVFQMTEKELSSGAITLSLNKQTAQKAGQDMKLTTTEFKLLHIFMQNPGQLLTREQLLQKLWDLEGNFIDDNTLSVHIRRLRGKVEEDPSKPIHIKTIRGTGYIWDEGCVRS